ncbi:galactose mutarotase-like protein, partial [Violaceomyces palustris]
MTSSFDPFQPVILSHPEAPKLQAHILPYGLVVQKLVLVGRDEEVHDLIVGPQDPRDHKLKGRNFFGPIIGRFANRLPAGKSTFTTQEGEKVEIDLPEFSSKGVCLHGGPELASENEFTSIEQPGPFDRAIWQPIHPSNSQLFHQLESSVPPSSSALFAIESPDGDQGYPGRLRVEVTFTLSPASADAAGSLTTNYRAKIIPSSSSTRKVVTPINLTQHWGFNLSSSSTSPQAVAEKNRIDQHTFRLVPPEGSTLYRLGLDEDMLPTGELIDCSQVQENEGRHDWNTEGGKKIQDGSPANGYDHFYLWGKPSQGDPSDLRAILSSETTGITLRFRTNQPGTQLYTTEGQPESPADGEKCGGAMKVIHRKHSAQPGEGNGRRSCAMIEFGGPHCGFLIKSLRELGGKETLLQEGQTYDNWVTIE